MSTEVPVRRIAFENYILEFVVKDQNTVSVLLLTDKDPTMVDTEYVIIESHNFNREAAEDGCDMEAFDTFSERVYGESQAWAREAIKGNEETRALAQAIANVLPPGIEA